MSARRQGHIEERSPGHWLIRYSNNEASGRRRFSTTIKGTRKDAERELRRRLDALDSGTHADPTRMTTGDYLDKWLATVREEISPRTHERYGEFVRHFLVPALGTVPITKLTPTHLQVAYTAWATGGRRDGREGGLSPTTRRHLHRVLHAALGRAVEQQVIFRNPAAVFRRRLPKVERHELAVLTAEQSAQLLDGIRNHRVYWPVLIALATGARRGEILALRWRHVDLDQRTIRLMESMEHTRAGIRFKPPKSGKARAVTIPGFAVDELRRWRREQSQELLRLGVRLGGDVLVCARADGEPMLPTSLTHEFAKVAGKVDGVPRVRFHDLRHSHATQLLAAGIHPKIAQERLGHSSISVTLDLYSHVSPTMQEDAAQKLDIAFRSGITRRS
jgi:integrase